MQDARLRRHALGFWELAHKPSPQELAAYYANTYYQNQPSSYRKSYSALETGVIDLRIALRAAQVAALTGRTSPGSMLDIGCGEGFVIRHFRSLGWQVAGLDPANRFYNALADVGLGRNLTAYLSPQTEAPTA